MKLLVLTPTLGRSPWLRQTVQSVRDYAENCRHVFIVPGECEAMMGELGQTVTDPGRGMYAALNAGLESVPDWDAFTYINDDDVLLSGFGKMLQTASRIAKRGDEALVYGSVRLIDSEGARLGCIPVSHFPTMNRALYAERLEPVYQHGTIITRAVWNRLGGFDETFRFCGDSEYLARLCLGGVPAFRVSATVAAFRLRAGQLTKNRVVMIAERRLVDEKLKLLVGPSRKKRLIARWIFRLANLTAYTERFARHGYISFDQLLDRAK